MAVAVLLGVDGGGTKTTALVADADGRVLGRGTAGGSNAKSTGEAAARAAVWGAIEQAYAAAGLRVQPPRAACLGLAGVDTPGDAAQWAPWVAQVLPGAQVRIVNDIDLVLAGGTPEEWGVAVIAGTGAIALGRAKDGRAARVGGWGWLLGDEGSGFWIGLRALQAVTRADDGRGPQTALTETVLARWGLAAPEGLLAAAYRTPFPRAEIAALTGAVEAAAGEGDETALAITREAGLELALAAEAVVRRLGLGAPVPGALAGGVLVRGRAVREAMLAALRKRGLALDPVQLVDEPAKGAVVIARGVAGGSGGRYS